MALSRRRLPQARLRPAETGAVSTSAKWRSDESCASLCPPSETNANARQAFGDSTNLMLMQVGREGKGRTTFPMPGPSPEEGARDGAWLLQLPCAAMAGCADPHPGDTLPAK